MFHQSPGSSNYKCCDGCGNALTNPLMGLVVVDVGDVLREDAAQVALVQVEQVAQAPAAYAVPELLMDCMSCMSRAASGCS